MEGRVLETERRKAVAPRRRRSRPARLRFLLAWSLASGAATRASQLWESDLTAIPSVVAGGLVLLAGIADGSRRRNLSMAAVCGSVGNLAILAHRLSQMDPTLDLLASGGGPGTTLAVSVAGGVCLLAMGVFRILPLAAPRRRGGGEHHAM